MHGHFSIWEVPFLRKIVKNRVHTLLENPDVEPFAGGLLAFFLFVLMVMV